MQSRIPHAVLLALVTAISVAAQPQLRQIVQQAAAAFDRGDFTQAAIAYKQAADLKPSPFAFYNAALALHKSSQLPTAARMYMQALESLKESPRRNKQQEADVAKNLGLLRLEQAETLHRAIQAIGGNINANANASCTTSLCTAIDKQQSLAAKAETLLKQAKSNQPATKTRQNRKQIIQQANLLGDIAKAVHLTGTERQSQAAAIAATALKQLIGPGKATQQRDHADPVAVSSLAADCLRYMTANSSQQPTVVVYPPVVCSTTIIRVLTPAKLARQCTSIEGQASTTTPAAANALCGVIQLHPNVGRTETKSTPPQQQTVYIAPEAAMITAEAAATVAPAAAIRLAAEAIIASSDTTNANAISWNQNQSKRLRSPLYELCRSLRAQGNHELAATIASNSHLWPNPEQLPQHPVNLQSSQCITENTDDASQSAQQHTQSCHLWSEPFPGRTSSETVDWHALTTQLQNQHPRLATEAKQGVARLQHVAESFKLLASITEFRCQLAQLAGVPTGTGSIPGCSNNQSTTRESAASHIQDNQGLANGRWDLLVFARDGKWTANVSLLSHQAIKAVRNIMDPETFNAANNSVSAPFVESLQPFAESGMHLNSALPPLGSIEMATLGPGSVIREHCGSTNARWRMHITVDDGVTGVPASNPATLSVSNSTYSWTTGDVMFFDDSFWHGVLAQTGTERPRVVLMVDIWHPLLLAHTPAAAALRDKFAKQIHWQPGTVGNVDLNTAIRTVSGFE